MGAALYVPATHKDVLRIANGETLRGVRTIIFCTEDSVGEKELPYALNHLSDALDRMNVPAGLNCFVRARNPSVLQAILAMRGSHKLAGFVLPKIHLRNFENYWSLLKSSNHPMMLTLETVDVFDDDEIKKLRHQLRHPDVQGRILALRIGGNDLLSLLGIRRPRNMTIYRTPLGHVIGKLATAFIPYGFAMTGPVFEYLNLPHLLEEEVEEDLAHGLVGKTAIHPSQVVQIEKGYAVHKEELEVAHQILRDTSPAVFRMHHSMCELATHRAWATQLLERAKVFGVYPDHHSPQNESTPPRS